MCAQETVGPSRYEVDGKMKKWNVLPCDWKAAEALAQRYQVPAAMGALLQTRGLTGPEQIEAMFGSEISLSDPMQMVDMDRAVERVWRAVNGFEKLQSMEITMQMASPPRRCCILTWNPMGPM